MRNLAYAMKSLYESEYIMKASKVSKVSAAPVVAAPVVAANISAKQHIRNLLSVDGAQLSVAQLCAASGKTSVNIITMLSDLRSVKYCGKSGTFNTVATKRDGVTFYSKAV